MAGILNLVEVLVVEDYKPDFYIIESILGKISPKYDLYLAEKLQDAFSYIDKRKLTGQSLPDIVLLDLNLPDSRGKETIVRFLAKHRNIPVIVMTGQGDNRFGVEAAKMGAQDYLPKDIFTKGNAGMLLEKAIVWAIERHRLQMLLIEHLKVEVFGMEAKRILSACSNCKRVKNPADGQWTSLDTWLEDWADLYLSHGICNDCAKTMYGDLIDTELKSRKEKKKNTGPLVK